MIQSLTRTKVFALGNGAAFTLHTENLGHSAGQDGSRKLRNNLAVVWHSGFPPSAEILLVAVHSWVAS